MQIFINLEHFLCYLYIDIYKVIYKAP